MLFVIAFNQITGEAGLLLEARGLWHEALLGLYLEIRRKLGGGRHGLKLQSRVLSL